MSYANSKNVGANHYRKGLKNFTNYLNRWGKGNKSIQGLIHGNVIDAMSTQLKMGQSLNYNQSMASHFAKINQGLENLKTGNQLKLMGAEGRIAGQLIGTQGEEQRKGIRETGAQQRLGLQTQGQQNRLTVAAQGAQNRLNLAAAGVEQRAGIRNRCSATPGNWRAGSTTALEHRRSRHSGSPDGCCPRR